MIISAYIYTTFTQQAHFFSDAHFFLFRQKKKEKNKYVFSP